MSKAKLLSFVAPGLLVAVLSSQASAATVTGSMSVSLTIPAACTLSVSQNINFGSQSPASSTTIQAGTTSGTTNGLLAVNCRRQATAVVVTLASGSTSSSSGGNMSNGSVTQPYLLYLPSNTTFGNAGLGTCAYASPTAWPGTGLSLTWSTSGNQNIAVCATTTIDQNTQAGSYSDTVNVTVTY